MLKRIDFEKREELLAPYAQKSKDSKGRRHKEPEHNYRSCYQRDRDRIIYSTAFRKLEYKTQVFVNHEGDYYRTHFRVLARSAGSAGEPRPQQIRQQSEAPKFPRATASASRSAGGPGFPGSVRENSFRGPLSLIEAHPLTGRTHQIRIHLAESGFPCVGDDTYGRGRDGFKLGLRAMRLAYPDPFTRRRVEVRAPGEEFCREYGFDFSKL